MKLYWIFLSLANAEATKKTYLTYLKSYTQFCHLIHIPLLPIHVARSPLNLVCFNCSSVLLLIILVGIVLKKHIIIFGYMSMQKHQYYVLWYNTNKVHGNSHKLDTIEMGAISWGPRQCVMWRWNLCTWRTGKMDAW